jgi:hypothetical protein
MVEEDIEAEIKAAAEADEFQEEREEKEEKKVLPKRGGIKKAKDEFFDDSDSEDEQITSGAYAKPSRGGGQHVNRGGRGGRGGRQGNIKLNEDEFPSL